MVYIVVHLEHTWLYPLSNICLKLRACMIPLCYLLQSSIPRLLCIHSPCAQSSKKMGRYARIHYVNGDEVDERGGHAYAKIFRRGVMGVRCVCMHTYARLVGVRGQGPLEN